MSGTGEKAAHASSNGAAKAVKKREVEYRRSLVSQLALSRKTSAQILEVVRKTTGVDYAYRTIMKDLEVIRADWLETQRESRGVKQAQELTALARDEAKLRTRMAKLDQEKPNEHKLWLEYQDGLLKLMKFRAELEGTAEPVKVDQRLSQQVVFTEDVSRILADPEATTRLLDAIQGPVLELPTVDSGSAPGG